MYASTLATVAALVAVASAGLFGKKPSSSNTNTQQGIPGQNITYVPPGGSSSDGASSSYPPELDNKYPPVMVFGDDSFTTQNDPGYYSDLRITSPTSQMYNIIAFQQIGAPAEGVTISQSRYEAKFGKFRPVPNIQSSLPVPILLQTINGLRDFAKRRIVARGQDPQVVKETKEIDVDAKDQLKDNTFQVILADKSYWQFTITMKPSLGADLKFSRWFAAMDLLYEFVSRWAVHESLPQFSMTLTKTAPEKNALLQQRQVMTVDVTMSYKGRVPN